MILLSRSGRQTTALAVVALAFCLTGCSSKECNAIGCRDGLEIAIESDAATGDALDITIDNEAAGVFVGLMTCSFEPTTRRLLCSSAHDHTVIANRVHFATQLLTLRVTVSAKGNRLSQEIVRPAYTAKEIWGEGCGVCTTATIQVSLPS